MHDFAGLSPRSTIFSASDDFSGNFLVGPMVKLDYRNIIGGKVVIQKYSQIGTNSIIMPNLTIGEGAATGAFSFVNQSIKPWCIYAGIPATFIKKRQKGLLQFHKETLHDKS